MKICYHIRHFLVDNMNHGSLIRIGAMEQKREKSKRRQMGKRKPRRTPPR